MNKKVLLVCDTLESIGDDPDYQEIMKGEEWKVERHCLEALKRTGYQTDVISIFDKIEPLLEKVKNTQPDVIFNMVESFGGQSQYERNIVGLFELMGVSYTGANPVATMLCKNKAMTKEVLSHHRIRAPRFKVFHRSKKIRRPQWLSFPLFLKPLREEASYGITKDSLVDSDKDFEERIQYIFDKINDDVIAEQFIDGRELYISILGNKRLQVFPIRELRFPQNKENAPEFATYKIKWDKEYRKKWGVRYEFATFKEEALEKEIIRLAKRTYRALRLQGFGRIDARLKEDGKIYILEVNTNPNLSADDDFALAARKAGLDYEKLMKRIVQLGLEYQQK